MKQTNVRAPVEYMVKNRLVHNFRELVEQTVQGQDGERSRFKYLNRSNKGNGYETFKSKIIRPMYSPSQTSSGDYSPGDVSGT